MELTAIDGRKLPITITRKLTPVTRSVRIDSSPAGAPIVYGGVSQTAPYEKLGGSTIGLHTTLSAAPTFTHEGSAYEFESWSDGGAAIHDLVIPDHDVALTASYRKLGGDTGVPREEPPHDTVPVSLKFDVKHGLVDRRKSVLRGTVSDPSGVGRVQVALRQAQKANGRCHWWSQRKGSFPHGTVSCAHPAYMKARLNGSGEQVSWVLALGGHLPAGRYLLYFRTEDGAGNVGGGPDGSKPASSKGNRPGRANRPGRVFRPIGPKPCREFHQRAKTWGRAKVAARICGSMPPVTRGTSSGSSGCPSRA